MFAVLPFGNATVIETLTYAQLVAAFVNGFKPPCGDVAGGTGRTPQFAGLKVTFHCAGTVPVIDSIVRSSDSKTLVGGRQRSASSPTTSCSPVATATRRSGRHERLRTGDLLLDVAIEYITDELAGRAGGRGPAGRSVEKPDRGPWHDSCRGPRLLERDAPLGALLGALRERRGRARLDRADQRRGGDRQDVAGAGVRGRARRGRGCWSAACDDLVTPRTLGPL